MHSRLPSLRVFISGSLATRHTPQNALAEDLSCGDSQPPCLAFLLWDYLSAFRGRKDERNPTVERSDVGKSIQAEAPCTIPGSYLGNRMSDSSMLATEELD